MPHFAPAQHEDHDGSTVGGVRPKNILQLDFISQLEDDHSNGLCRAWRTSLPNRKRLSDESDRAVQATAPLRSRFRRPAHSQARGGIGVHIPWLWKNPKPVRLDGPGREYSWSLPGAGGGFGVRGRSVLDAGPVHAAGIARSGLHDDGGGPDA